MADFRSFLHSKRIAAEPMQPVIDPAGWSSENLGSVDDFSYAITDRDADELVAGVAAFRRHGAPIEEVSRENFPLQRFAVVLADVRRELIDGRGEIGRASGREGGWDWVGVGSLVEKEVGV